MIGVASPASEGNAYPIKECGRKKGQFPFDNDVSVAGKVVC